MLENIDAIMGRMQAIESRMQVCPVDSEGFRSFMNHEESVVPANARGASATGRSIAEQALNNKGSLGMNPAQFGPPRTGGADVVVIPQHNAVSCGQTSVAMTINALTGKSYTDADINNKYGFELLNALNGECSASGFQFKDGGEIGPDKWALIDRKVNQERIPVVVALNGPEFSPSGHGHIVTIMKTEGDKVTFADPATGTVRTTTKQNMNNAPQHPDGNFIFYGTRQTGPDLAVNP